MNKKINFNELLIPDVKEVIDNFEGNLLPLEWEKEYLNTPEDAREYKKPREGTPSCDPYVLSKDRGKIILNLKRIAQIMERRGRLDAAEELYLKSIDLGVEYREVNLKLTDIYQHLKYSASNELEARERDLRDREDRERDLRGGNVGVFMDSIEWREAQAKVERQRKKSRQFTLRQLEDYLVKKLSDRDLKDFKNYYDKRRDCCYFELNYINYYFSSYYMLGRLYNKYERYEDAINISKRGICDSFGSVESKNLVYQVIIEAYTQQEQYDKVIEVCKEFLQSYPFCTDIRSSLKLAHTRKAAYTK